MFGVAYLQRAAMRGVAAADSGRHCCHRVLVLATFDEQVTKAL